MNLIRIVCIVRGNSEGCGTANRRLLYPNGDYHVMDSCRAFRHSTDTARARTVCLL